MTKAEREKASRMHRCPKCNAQPYFSCVRYKGIKPVSLTHPHAERVEQVWVNGPWPTSTAKEG